MSEVKNKYRYELTDRFGTMDVAPLGEGDFSIKYNRETDGKYFYSKTFQGKITFTGEIFKRLKRIERSIYICTTQRLKVFRKCNAGEMLIFDGFFKLTEGDWDDDKCRVTLKFEKNTPDKCLKDNKSKKLNLLQLIQNKITVKPSTANGTIEYKNCFQDSPSGVSSDYWCGTGDPYEQNWTLVSYNEHSPDGVHYQVNNTWVREIIELNCGEVAPPEWVLVEDNCGTTGKKKFAKQVMLYDCVSDLTPIDENGAYKSSMSCKILGYDSNTTTIDNGMHLTDVLNLFVSQFCADVQVVSDFFQINPQNPSEINYVTGLKSQVNNLILFQKSDVKRPNATGNAWKAEWTFEKLMETLNILFNVSYSLENGVFRLEHISWFSKNAGLNLTLPAFEKWVKGKRKYSYDVGDIPIRENWKFKEAISYTGGWNAQIDYAGACAIGSNKEAEKNYVVEELTTDVQLCLENPSSDSNVVEDLGFVLIATKKYNGEYFIITEADATYGTRLNNSLSFNKLVRRYHSHNRPLNKGVLNGDEITFITTKPIKKGEKLTVPLCCETTFDPNNTVTTELGVGIVDGAQFNLMAETLELDLLYDVFDTLTNNQAPQLAGGAYSTYQNVPIVIPLNAVDADGVIAEIGIKNQAYHGTVEVLSLTEVKYTPNAGYTGWDSFSLVAFDDWSEVSNVAGFGITINPPNQPPTARDESYNVFHGENFNAQISIFENDSDDYGFTLANANIVTALGVNITIDGNGRFNYIPPAGFEGVDTFQYSIVDNAGLTSTATVTLNIAFKNKPIAVADDYITQKNTQLVTDGSVGKEALFANDYTPDGQTYAYTCNVENKATTAGGTVQIQANGLFTYNPPANFTGQDTFSYTVNNVNGSDTGTVTIHVLPTIYVKLLTSDPKTYGHASDEYRTKTRDYTLYFYSDAAGTQPLDVTGFGLKVKISETYNNINGGSNTTIWETNTVSGVSYKFYDDFVYFDRSDYGSLGYDVVISIAAGSYVII